MDTLAFGPGRKRIARVAGQEQATAYLNRTLGCVRKVYNLALDARTRAWTTEKRSVSYVETSAMLTAWKRDPDLAYLSEVSCVPLQQALRHLHAAYTAFSAQRSRHPRFRSKRGSRASAEYTRSGFRFRDGQLTLAKHNQPLAERADRTLAKAQRAHARTVTGSKNRERARVKVARIHARIGDRRRDHLHKLTTRLVPENQTVVIEGLTVRNILLAERRNACRGTARPDPRKR